MMFQGVWWLHLTGKPFGKEKNENHFRPYLITPFGVSDYICKPNSILMSVRDTKIFLIFNKFKYIYTYKIFCQSFFSLFGYLFRNRSLWIIYVNCYFYLFCMPRSSGRWYWGAFLPALWNAKPIPLGGFINPVIPSKLSLHRRMIPYFRRHNFATASI
jgi:hypothetical protein